MSEAETRRILEAIHQAPSADTFWTEGRMVGSVDAAEKGQAETIIARLQEKTGQEGHILFGIMDVMGDDFATKTAEADELLADNLAAEIVHDKNFIRFRSNEMPPKLFLERVESRVLSNLDVYFDYEDSDKHRFWTERVKAYFQSLRGEQPESVV